MNEKDFNSSVTAKVPGGQLQKIYLRLENETRPYAMRVSKSDPYVRRVTIYCDAENITYFKAITNNGNKA